MSTTKTSVSKQTYHISAKLTMDVGKEILATSLEDAVVKANELKIQDFINFGELGLDHNDSSDPDVYIVWRDD